jgi:hypothetical protein
MLLPFVTINPPAGSSYIRRIAEYAAVGLGSGAIGGFAGLLIYLGCKGFKFIIEWLKANWINAKRIVEGEDTLKEVLNKD